MNEILFKSHPNAIRRAGLLFRADNVVHNLEASISNIRLVTDSNLLYDKAEPFTIIYNKTYDRKNFEEASRLKNKRCKIIFDICDNHFLNEEVIDDLKKFISICDLVTTSTLEMHKRILENTGVEAIILPDVVFPSVSRHSIIKYNLEKFFTNRVIKKSNIKLVWFGNGYGKYECGISDIIKIKDQLNDLSKSHNISLTIISNSKTLFLELKSHLVFLSVYSEWNSLFSYDLLKLHDICIVPITTNDFTICKSENRVITALNAGLRVVATNIPSYNKFRDDNVDGVSLCQNLDEFSKKITIEIGKLDKNFISRYPKLYHEQSLNKWREFLLGLNQRYLK